MQNILQQHLLPNIKFNEHENNILLKKKKKKYENNMAVYFLLLSNTKLRNWLCKPINYSSDYFALGLFIIKPNCPTFIHYYYQALN